MKYSKEFKEEALKLSDEIGLEKGCSAARYPVLHAVRLAKQAKCHCQS
jgi:hypothetical protein